MTLAAKPSPGKIPPVGYPFALELSSAALVIAQLVLSRIALERLPSTVVPYFGAGGTSLGLPGAGFEAEGWGWMIVGLWAILVGASALFYRTVRSTPIPIFSVALFAHLAVLRAGVISLNLTPLVSPRRVMLRALLVGVVALLLAVVVERVRSRKLLAPALVGASPYDEQAPKGLPHWILLGLAGFIPLILVPTRVRVVPQGVLVVTPVSYFMIPALVIDRVERARWLQALLGAGVNLASNPKLAVRVFRHRRLFPVVFSVRDPDRFIEAVTELKSTGHKKSQEGHKRSRADSSPPESKENS